MVGDLYLANERGKQENRVRGKKRNQGFISLKKSVVKRQKRPIIDSKETYYRGKSVESR